MKQEQIIQTVKYLIEEMGVKGVFLARKMGVSYTYLKQVLNGERTFGYETLRKASGFLSEYVSSFKEMQI